MDHPKMTLYLIKGSDIYADARLMTFDGFVIPFHRVVFVLKQLKGCKLETLLNDHFRRDPQAPVRLEFDGQTVWRVISFLYDGTYQDEDEDLTFPKVEVPASPTSANRPSNAPTENQEVALVQDFRKLHITSQSCASDTLLKALASVKVYQAASDWDIDRLMIEAGQRFGGYVSGAFDKDDFPQFIDAVLNSVTGPAELLYDHLVLECFTHCQQLVNNTNFLTVLEHNGKLAVRLYRELARFQASSSKGASAVSPPAPSALGAGSSTSNTASPLLQDQLTQARNANSVKDEQINILEQEVAHLKKSTPGKISSADLEARILRLNAEKADKVTIIDNLEGQLDQKDDKINDLERVLADANKRNAALVNQIKSKRAGQPDSTSIFLERNEAREKAKKLQSRLTTSEDKIKELEALLATHAQQPIIVNSAFVPQPNTNGNAQPPHPTTNGTSQPLHSTINGNAQLPHFTTNGTPQPPHSTTNGTAQPSQNGRREIIGFGSMDASMNSIGLGSGSAAASASPTSPTPTARTIPAPAAQNHISGGPVTFFDKIRRSQAAGINGGSTTSSQAPPSMPVRTRGDSTEGQQPTRSLSTAPSASSTVTVTASSPANGASRGPHAALGRCSAGPHSPRVNGGPHTASGTPSVAASPRVNGTAQPSTPLVNGHAVTPGVASASAHAAVSAGTPSASAVGTPLTTPSAAPAAPAATPVTIPNGQGSSSADGSDRIIGQLGRENTFLRNQLNDARHGPGGPGGPGGHGGHGGHGGRGGDSARLERVLKALREYDLDHKACNDCSINFNAQWRGMVDNIDNPDLILMCNKCGEEKCRWRC